MNKPQLTDFQRFARITLQRYERYLPTAFDESLTLLEKMNKLIEYLNAMGMQLGDVVEQWNEVMEWIVADGITDTVLERLDEMVDDGTLATIINEHIFNELNNKVDTKADKDYVDDELGKKADSDYVDGELNTKASTSTENTTIYVSPYGDDSNPGTNSEPVRNISKAIEMLPDLIGKGHVYTIILEEGIFNEVVYLDNITVQGELVLEGSTTNRENHKIIRLRANNILGHFRISNITASVKDTSGTSFWFTRCAPGVRVDNVATESDPNNDVSQATGIIGLLADYGSNIYVSNSHFEGKRYGLRVNYMSRIFSTNNTGSGNHFGVGARWGGIISTYGTIPSATALIRNRSTDSGGLIIEGSGVNMGLPRDDIYLVDRTANKADGRYYKKLYNISSINASNREILPGQKIKLKFKGVAVGPHRLNIKFSSSRPPNASSQHIERIWTGTLATTNFRTPEMTTVYNNDFAPERVEVVHTGSGLEFEVIITPLSADNAQWAVEIEAQIMRSDSAPNLIDVVIE